jgi:hypothetical protein
VFVALGRFAFLFAPLPSFQGIPIGVVFSAFASLLPTFLGRFRSGFARCDTFSVDIDLRDDLFFNFKLAVDLVIHRRLVQAQVGSEVIFLRRGEAIFLGLGDA